MTENYIIKPNSNGDIDAGRSQTGLKYVGFQVRKIKKGDRIRKESNKDEICVVVLSGIANAKTSKMSFERIGNRKDIFEQIPPYSVYVTMNDFIELEALSDSVELAICYSPSKGNHPSRLIPPEHVEVIERGSGNMKRYVHNILPEDKDADSLLVVEVFTPGGNWSSYPPHKHDTLNLPHESQLEETYYHRMKPETGFAFQRIYTDDLSINEGLVINDGVVAVVPKGYHPVSASPGHELYYLNVMAGPERLWRFQNEKNHEWLLR